MNFLEGFGKLKVYIAIMAVVFGGYIWAGIRGTRILGDDNATKEERTHASGNSFNHK